MLFNLWMLTPTNRYRAGAYPAAPFIKGDRRLVPGHGVEDWPQLAPASFPRSCLEESPAEPLTTVRRRDQQPGYHSEALGW